MKRFSDSMDEPRNGDHGIEYEVIGVGREDSGNHRMETIVLRYASSASAYDFPRRIRDVIFTDGVWKDR